MIVIVTGVPGTGKTTLAKSLAKHLQIGLAGANELLMEKGLWKGKERGALVADLGKLKRALASLSKNKKGIVLEGHLLCEMKLKADIAMVLRSNPLVLKKRLRARGYPEWKVNENVMAECLDYCTIKAEQNYCNVFEIDTSGSAKESLAQAKRILLGKGKKAGWVNWGKELEQEAGMKG